MINRAFEKGARPRNRSKNVQICFYAVSSGILGTIIKVFFASLQSFASPLGRPSDTYHTLQSYVRLS